MYVTRWLQNTNINFEKNKISPLIQKEIVRVEKNGNLHIDEIFFINPFLFD